MFRETIFLIIIGILRLCGLIMSQKEDAFKEFTQKEFVEEKNNGKSNLVNTCLTDPGGGSRQDVGFVSK